MATQLPDPQHVFGHELGVEQQFLVDVVDHASKKLDIGYDPLQLRRQYDWRPPTRGLVYFDPKSKVAGAHYAMRRLHRR